MLNHVSRGLCHDQMIAVVGLPSRSLPNYKGEMSEIIIMPMFWECYNQDNDRMVDLYEYSMANW